MVFERWCSSFRHWCSSVLLYLGYAIDRHDTRTATLKCTLEHSRIPTLEHHARTQVLVEKCDMDKAFLFDVASKIYIAENPPALADSDRYELSADMIDVVIDVLCIYGSDDGSGGVGFDSEACSVIHLNGTRDGDDCDVLYLRQVSSELAVVCILREENFTSKGLVDYNIEMFKKALDSVVQIKKSTEMMDNSSISTKVS